METPVLIPIDLIHKNPFQPREVMDPEKVAELAASIKHNTLLQVPSARAVNGHYELAFGHRRLEAFKLNGETQMPLIVRDLDDLQMFEMATAENIQRHDLNPIEEARAMQRYMDEFKKTSVEAGEFFACSPEKVRATVRLLDLAPVAQEKLASGEINVAGARLILSAQKIAPPETIEQTVQLMAKGEDRHGNASTAAEIVGSQLRVLDETVRMWNENNRDGKPRSSEHYGDEGWPLSMKNFPNKFLPELTPVDMAIALGIQDDQHLIAAANTWAMSGRGQFDNLPQDVLDQIPMNIREKIDHLLNPPACSACPFYTKIDSVHYCGMKTCHDRKTVAWHYAAFDAGLRDLKIPAYDKKDGTYRVISSYGDDEKLFNKRNRDLRLIQRDQVKGYHHQHFPGVKDESFLVVLIGETLKKEKAGVRQERQETKQAQTADQLRLELIAENRQRLEWMVAQEVRTLFDGFTWKAIHTLSEAAFDWSVDVDDVPEDCRMSDGVRSESEQTEFRRTLLSLAMIREANTTDDRNLAKLYDYYERLVIITKEWKVRPSKRIGAWAMRTDQEIAEAVTAVTGKKNGKR